MGGGFTYSSIAASATAQSHWTYGGLWNRSLKSLPLGSSMVTKAAHQRAMRKNSNSTRRKWIRCVESVLESVMFRLRMSEMVSMIVRSEAETVCESVVVRGQRSGGDVMVLFSWVGMRVVEQCGGAVQ